MADVTYVAVDPEGAFYQAYDMRFDEAQRKYVGRGHYDDPAEGRRLRRTMFRLFANADNWKQKQRRPSEPGITGSRLFELRFTPERGLEVTAEIE